jgi:hypothetical protein
LCRRVRDRSEEDKIRRALIVAVLSVALLGVATSSASAVTFSPPSINFGRVPRGYMSPPQTFTLTKESNLSKEGVYDIELVANRSLEDWKATSNCPSVMFLTDTTPTCTVTITFTPLLPGKNGAGIFRTIYGGSSGSVTGFGASNRKCESKNQYGNQVRYKKKCKGFRRQPGHH